MKKVYNFLLLIAIIVIGCLGFFNNRISNEIQTLKNENKTLLKQNDSIVLLEQKNALKTQLLTFKIDSLIQSDSIQKKQLKKISKKYAKLKMDYDSANDVVKDSIFAALINQ